jgi:hypothetical protein
VQDAHSSEEGALHKEQEHHSEGEDVHEDSMHLAGAAVGVASGVLLLMGHIFSMRAARRCREECCE